MMSRKSLFVFAAICAAVVAVAGQSSLAGTWKGEDAAASAPIPVVLKITVTGSDVTGTVTVGDSPAQPVLEGRVDGRRLTFKTTLLLNGKEVSISWEGLEKGDRLSLVRTFGSGGRKLPPIVLQRGEQVP
jgi:hypothetical protein